MKSGNQKVLFQVVTGKNDQLLGNSCRVIVPYRLQTFTKVNDTWENE